MQVGFYGKLPSHGDFLRRRVSDAFVDAWDAWLRECLAASRTALGARWLDVYLTSPAWRFVCAPGACGPAPVIGLLAPSVDQVGRYFPLTLVAELPDGRQPRDRRRRLEPCSSTPPSGWSSRRWRPSRSISSGSISGVGGAGAGARRRDRARRRSSSTPRPSAMLDGQPAGVADAARRSFHLPAPFEQLLSLQLEAKYRPLVLGGPTDRRSSSRAGWCSRGCRARLVSGLPRGILDRASLAIGPCACPGGGDAARASHAADLEAGPLSFRSAAATDVGRARSNNEDGFPRAARSRALGRRRRHGRAQPRRGGEPHGVRRARGLPARRHVRRGGRSRRDAAAGGQRSSAAARA